MLSLGSEAKSWYALHLLRFYAHAVISDEISVKTGEQVKLDVLFSRADKVETNSSGEWREVWKRGHGVWSERMTDRDGNLTIKEFTSNDTGTYRVLDSEGEILITVTVTGERSSVDPTDQHRILSTYRMSAMCAIVISCKCETDNIDII
uniref:Uncharacterized protein n=1 Tax=Cyprinus carpio TaxID=7962 RepID=A0A8C1U9J2_CYPCA